ncbi:hypothetical protein LCGC14_1721140, partial [marine sediment metagenome]
LCRAPAHRDRLGVAVSATRRDLRAAG